jgi:hypothetical protein
MHIHHIPPSQKACLSSHHVFDASLKYPGISPSLKKQSQACQRYIFRQLGHLIDKTRRFLSPPHGGFGFVGTFPF